MCGVQPELRRPGRLGSIPLVPLYQLRRVFFPSKAGKIFSLVWKTGPFPPGRLLFFFFFLPALTNLQFYFFWRERKRHFDLSHPLLCTPAPWSTLYACDSHWVLVEKKMASDPS